MWLTKWCCQGVVRSVINFTLCFDTLCSNMIIWFEVGARSNNVRKCFGGSVTESMVVFDGGTSPEHRSETTSIYHIEIRTLMLDACLGKHMKRKIRWIRFCSVSAPCRPKCLRCPTYEESQSQTRLLNESCEREPLVTNITPKQVHMIPRLCQTSAGV